jgi:hypothetical protein
MLSPTISTSPRVNAMSLKSALVYTWLLSHCDDQGRFAGDAATVKGVVCPLRTDISEDDIKLSLVEMESRGLIQAYKPEDFAWSPIQDLIQIVDWWDYQHLRDPQPSKYPAPHGWQDRIGAQTRDERGRYRTD